MKGDDCVVSGPEPAVLSRRRFLGAAGALGGRLLAGRTAGLLGEQGGARAEAAQGGGTEAAADPG